MKRKQLEAKVQELEQRVMEMWNMLVLGKTDRKRSTDSKCECELIEWTYGNVKMNECEHCRSIRRDSSQHYLDCIQHTPPYIDHRTWQEIPEGPKQDDIPWEDLPDWVQWVAKQKGGYVYGYRIEPSIESESWMIYGVSRNNIIYIPELNIPGDWKDSLRQRPGTKKPEPKPEPKPGEWWMVQHGTEPPCVAFRTGYGWSNAQDGRGPDVNLDWYRPICRMNDNQP